MKIFSKKDLENKNLKTENVEFDANINKEEMVEYLIEKYSDAFTNEDNIFYSELLLKLLPTKMSKESADKIFLACSSFLSSLNPVFVTQAQKITDNILEKKVHKIEEEKSNELEVKNDIKFVKEHKYFQECLIDKENKDCLNKNLPILLEKASSYMLNLYKEDLLDVLLNEIEFKTFPSLQIIQRKINIYKEIVLFLVDKKCASVLKK
ncbi:hypothetical protein TUBRATIS_19260 [Tubulinosema ratisbonensis]|uniref:Uncharacterized protein n=1 Tax=Tubulinosema ratisbonensis TaxID=291195 RepID=A0A437AKK5_9MICR|nr:hypothetical protein TUBRATIS_19260 [Tubulinosema ratisbonensis]